MAAPTTSGTNAANPRVIRVRRAAIRPHRQASPTATTTASGCTRSVALPKIRRRQHSARQRRRVQLSPLCLLARRLQTPPQRPRHRYEGQERQAPRQIHHAL